MIKTKSHNLRGATVWYAHDSKSGYVCKDTNRDTAIQRCQAMIECAHIPAYIAYRWDKESHCFALRHKTFSHVNREYGDGQTLQAAVHDFIDHCRTLGIEN